MYFADFEEEEEEAGEENENKPRKGKVTINFDPNVLYNEGKSFSFRDESSQQSILPQVKDWKQIAFDFLSNQDDYIDIGTTDSFQDIDTQRAEEFVAGQGATNWTEIRRKALESSKEKKRRSRK